jgi:hypothetical protein
MLGCGAVEYKGKVSSQYSPAYSSNTNVASAGKPAAAVDDPAMVPEYSHPAPRRPSEHEMAVHNYHKQQKAKARNDGYWTVNQVKVDRADKEAIEMLKKKREAVASGGQVGEPGPSTILTNKKKKEAMRRLRLQREAVMNGLGDVVAHTKNRLDLKPDRLNKSRMPGNGLVGMQANDHYISMEECPNHNCVNKALTNKAKMDRLGNPLGR